MRQLGMKLSDSDIIPTTFDNYSLHKSCNMTLLICKLTMYSKGSVTGRFGIISLFPSNLVHIRTQYKHTCVPLKNLRHIYIQSFLDKPVHKSNIQRCHHGWWRAGKFSKFVPPDTHSRYALPGSVCSDIFL